ncbi:MAG: hypothetical protein K0S51_806 [Bacillales bacterium]|jgi:hypothetical protein|nr:hypothetical protein [Bacillales bacterium]
MTVNLYSKLETKDITIFSNILQNTSFEIEEEKNSVFNKKVGDFFYYLIFTKDREIINPLLFAYSVKLEPIQIYSVSEKDSTVVCFKSNQKYKHSEVEHILSQMIANANFFRFAEEDLNKSAESFIAEMSEKQHNTSEFSPEQLLAIKILFTTGYVYYVNFDFEKIKLISNSAIEIALETLNKPLNNVTIAELRNLALTDEYFNKLQTQAI